jgi:hypothetical protein
MAGIKINSPKRHHIDKRAADLLASTAPEALNAGNVCFGVED